MRFWDVHAETPKQKSAARCPCAGRCGIGVAARTGLFPEPRVFSRLPNVLLTVPAVKLECWDGLT